MSARSTTVTAGATASVLVVGAGNANVPRKVAVVPAADILIGGADTQTFPVSTAGITFDLTAGDTVWVKRAAAADVTVEVFELGV